MSDTTQKKKRVVRRGINMVNTRNYLIRKIDDGGRLVEDRATDDMRLPMSPLTYEEFKEGKKLLEECTRQKDELAKKSAEKSAPRYSRQPGHPYHPMFVHFSKLREIKLKEGLGENECIICGEEMNREGYPYCAVCGRMLLQNKLRGRDNTLGYLNWNRNCVVCHHRKADLNMKGMCRACYRLGERYGTHDPKDVRKLRRERLKRTIQKGELIPNGKSGGIGIGWESKKWD